MGRGRGRGGGRRGGNRGGGRGRGGGHAAHVPSPAGDTSLVTLKADQAFWDKLGDRACPATVVKGPDALQDVQLKLESWKDLPALLGWFRDGLDGDAGAELSFHPKLNKTQRALVHNGAETVGLGGLESVSRGVGDDRYVTVLLKGRGDSQRVSLTEQQEHKAYWLWRWAQQGGFEVSRDEVAEMVRDNKVRPELEEVWAAKSAQQKALQALCSAAATGDLPAVRSLVAANPGILTDGVFDLLTGVAPLHVATKTGQLAAVELLLELGAPLEGQDGAGLTALQIARKFDQSDAEGVLLRAGAADPDARNWPGEAAEPAPAAPAPAEPPAAAAAPAAQQQQEQQPQQPVAAAAADGAGASPRSGAAAARGAAGAANGVLQPPQHSAPRSVAASEGDSESAIDSAASVCGTDTSRNVGDVSSIAGDTLTESEAAVSPRAVLPAPPSSTLEVVGEEEGGTSEAGSGAADEPAEDEMANSRGSGEAEAEAEGEGAGAAEGVGDKSEEGVLAAAGSEEGGSSGGRGKEQEGSEAGGSPVARRRGTAQGGLLAEYLAVGRGYAGSDRSLDVADLESTRSVCGSEMTYQQSLDVGSFVASVPDTPLAAASEVAADAAPAVAVVEAAAEGAAAGEEPASVVEEVAAAAAPMQPEAEQAAPEQQAAAAPVDKAAAEEAAAAALAAAAAAEEAGGVQAPPAAVQDAAPGAVPEPALAKAAGEQQQQAAPLASRQWAVTGVASVDGAITEWAEWAGEHRGTVIAGAGIVAGLLLLLGGRRG